MQAIVQVRLRRFFWHEPDQRSLRHEHSQPCELPGGAETQIIVRITVIVILSAAKDL